MNELKEDTQETNNETENIKIEILSETKVLEPKKSQKEEKIYIPVDKYTNTIAKQDIGLKRIASEDINPVFYEIGPFPRRPQRVWVQVMGLHPVPTEGEPLVYEPSRNDFVRLVFTIVFIMLVITSGICVFCNICDPVKKILQDRVVGLGLVVGGGVLTMAMSYAFTCSTCTRTFPCSVICLAFTVIGFSAICVYFTIKYKTVTIALALGTTTIIVLICLGLACTRFDFTRFILVVAVAMLAVSIATLGYVLYCTISGERIQPLHCVLLIVGTLIHSVSLIIEFQMVIGGKTVELSTEDYSLGAFLIYSSIITIFIKMMQLMNMLDDD